MPFRKIRTIFYFVIYVTCIKNKSFLIPDDDAKGNDDSYDDDVVDT